MNIGVFNARGINETEHFIPLEIEELRNKGHNVNHFWIKGIHPTQSEVDAMDFAIYHFVPTALHFMNQYVPFCILPTANDIFPNNGAYLKVVDGHPMCKFIGYQSFYHKRKYEEWGLVSPFVHAPHAVRTNIFKRNKPYNPNGKLVSGGRLIPKKRLDKLKGIKDLTIFGDGPLRKPLEEYLSPDATFVGHLDGMQLKELYEDCSVYLFPAMITESGDSEGISNTIKEAMLMELQVICTPITGNTEFENVSFLSDWNEEAVYKAIDSVPKEENKKGRKEILNNFSPDICVNKLLDGIQKYG